MVLEGQGKEGMRAFLQAMLRAGRVIAGVDEAGRGPLAGPIVAAAVAVVGDFGASLFADPSPFQDSKKLSPKEREERFRLLYRSGALYAVGKASPEEIDRLNVRKATALAMRRALQGLKERIRFPIDLALIDGDDLGDLGFPCRFIVNGDALCPLISAASIVAKVTRDRLMRFYDKRYPGYGFAQNKGYPTPQHLKALRRLGPSPIHRKSYAPVREILAASKAR